MQVEIKNAHQLTEPGYYWWRSCPIFGWRPEFFDPINAPGAIKLMGGQFIGPLEMPGANRTGECHG